MIYNAVKCDCGVSVCPDWHVTTVACVQGVSFTEKQARLVADTLNTCGDDESKLQQIAIPDGTVRREWEWTDPTPEMLEDPKFERIWQLIKTWDIAVPGAYGGYCGATGNHVCAILNALKSGDK